MSGGGEVVDGKKVERRLRKSTVTSWSKSKTRETKFKKAKAGRTKKMGPKLFSGKEPGQVEPVSSQSGILRYFSTKTSPEEVGNPMGFRTPLQIPAEKKNFSSVLLRPISKKDCL